MSALSSLLDSFRAAAVTEREKGTYFEELVCVYLRNEATYRDLYEKVWTYADWANKPFSMAGAWNWNLIAPQWQLPLCSCT